MSILTYTCTLVIINKVNINIMKIKLIVLEHILDNFHALFNIRDAQSITKKTDSFHNNTYIIIIVKKNGES